MNKQNFENESRFPLSIQSLSFMQDMILAATKLALIGGNNYILSGCTVNGNKASDGIIVINGEIMPFAGGTIVKTITVIEESETVSANAMTFKDVRVRRYAKFATGTGVDYYPWADFRPLQSNQQLEEAKATVKYVDAEIEKITAGSIPAGVIVMWSGSVTEIPAGWQLCDNSLIPGTSRRTPDLRGKFIVGFNNDDDDYRNLGGTGGERTVVIDESQIPAHRHVYSDDTNAEGKFSLDKTLYPDDKNSFPEKYKTTENRKSSADSSGSGNLFYTSYAGKGQAHENRPPYYVLAFIIKI